MRRSWGAGLVAVGALGAYVQSLLPFRGSALSFVMVGQGDCALVQEGSFVAVVDTGGWVEGRDVGGRLALPFLRSRGVHKVDLLVVTHPDADHAGGMRSFFRRYEVGRVAIPARFAADPAMRRWLSDAAVPLGRVVWVEDRVSFGVGSLQLSLSAPPFGPEAPENDGSMVVRATWPSASFLLTGDAGSETEAWMVDQGEQDATVLKAGHHGSRTSSSPAFLQAVSPRASVVSCGRANRYGHPNQGVIDRLVGFGPVYRTDRHGDVVFSVTADGYRVTTSGP
jgi:competence protein ComEC